MKIIFFNSVNGRIPVYEFLQDLSKADRAKVFACLKNIEELGFDCPRVQFRQLKGKLWEIKIQAADSSYRIFYVTLKSNLLVLLHAYKKQSQKAPKKELEIAERRMMEVLKDETVYT
jgi:phage-related protein